MVSTSLQNVSLPAPASTTSMAGNLTVSELSLTLKKRDHGSSIVCVASNPIFEPVSVQAELTVNYPPVVEVYVSGDRSPNRMVEGEDVSLECRVDSRPPPTTYSWMKDGIQVSEDSTLLLRNTSSEDTGTYSCIVHNVEGWGESSPVRVSVLYRPTCSAAQLQHHSQETDSDTPGIDLRCEVDAKPVARSYRWLFNSSGGSFEIPSAKPLMSFINYAESKNSEDGVVLCWATNEVGVQTEPCVFHVVPLGPPHPPVDCDISARTLGSVEVECNAGFGGGLEQHFVLEVFEMVNGTQELVASNWSRDPTVQVVGLEANTSYILAVHSANDKGVSPSVYVGGQTASLQPRLPTSPDRLPLLYIIIVVLCSVMFLSLVLSITAACRRCMLVRKAQKLTENPPIINTYSDRSDLDQTVPLVCRRSSERIERKVSFRECACSREARLANSVSSGTLNGTRRDSRNQLPQKTIVRSYSIGN